MDPNWNSEKCLPKRDPVRYVCVIPNVKPLPKNRGLEVKLHDIFACKDKHVIGKHSRVLLFLKVSVSCRVLLVLT